MEVLFKRPAHDRTESVRREGSRKNRKVATNTLEGSIQHAADFVFKVLSCNKRVDQELIASSKHWLNFSTSSCKVFVIVESLPHLKKRSGPELSAHVHRDHDLRIEYPAKCNEKPTMRVDFPGILLL